MIDQPDFYSDRKFCTSCEDYVPYLMSLEHSYCAHCGANVKLFSEKDWETFHASLKERRPKGGRPRKQQQRQRKSGGEDVAKGA